jgi:hypothetical protein
MSGPLINLDEARMRKDDRAICKVDRAHKHRERVGDVG